MRAGINNLERLYLELGSLRVELEESPLMGEKVSQPGLEQPDAAD